MKKEDWYNLPKENLTYKLLYPCIFYGKDINFITLLQNVNVLSVGIHDTLLNDPYKAGFKALYILLDCTENKYVYDLISWIRNMDYYVTDYPIGDVSNFDKFMIVIKVPKEFIQAYDKFVSSLFSEMYTKQQISSLSFDKDVIPVLEGKMQILPYNGYEEIFNYFTLKRNVVDVEDIL